MSPMEQLAKQEYERGYSDGKSDYFAAGVAEGEMRARQRMIANRVVANQHPFAASGKPIDHIASTGKMIGCAYCDNPLFAGTKCNNCGRVTLAEPVKQEPVPTGATHYQPHQKTYYKRVSATEWYLWSCTGKGWLPSKGTSDSSEWIMLSPIQAHQPAKQAEQEPVGYFAYDEEHDIWEELTGPNAPGATPLYAAPVRTKDLTEKWIDPNDKSQKQYLPHIGEKILFCCDGEVYYGHHTGGSFQKGYGVTKSLFPTWDCMWMHLPTAVISADREKNK